MTGMEVLLDLRPAADTNSGGGGGGVGVGVGVDLETSLGYLLKEASIALRAAMKDARDEGDAAFDGTCCSRRWNGRAS